MGNTRTVYALEDPITTNGYVQVLNNIGVLTSLDGVDGTYYEITVTQKGRPGAVIATNADGEPAATVYIANDGALTIEPLSDSGDDEPEEDDCEAVVLVPTEKKINALASAMSKIDTNSAVCHVVFEDYNVEDYWIALALGDENATNDERKALLALLDIDVDYRIDAIDWVESRMVSSYGCPWRVIH